MCPRACLSLRIGTSIIEAKTLKCFLFKWDACHVDKGGNLVPSHPIPYDTSSRANKRVKRGTFESLKQVVTSGFDGT